MPDTFITSVTVVPRMLVTESELDPAVTRNASLTAEPPIVAFPDIVADAALKAPETAADATESADAVAVIAPAMTVRPLDTVADAQESAPEIVADATVRAELAALIAPAEIVSPAARVARPDA